MYLIVFALIGLAASGAARLLAKKNPAASVRAFVTAGLVGALAGGLLGRFTGFHGDETELAGASLAILGAAIALLSVRAVARGRAAASNDASELQDQDP